MHKNSIDYSVFAPVEKYLIEVVRPRFQKQGFLNAFDFFCIVIWKANRAKSTVAKRLIRFTKTKSLDSICKRLTREIYEKAGDREKLLLLLENWKFRLPMASAILSILYPDRFTVYDFRVCSQIKGFNHLDSKSNPRKCDEYFNFLQAVKDKVSEKSILKAKDRWLWGKSFAEDLRRDIGNNFK